MQSSQSQQVFSGVPQQQAAAGQSTEDVGPQHMPVMNTFIHFKEDSPTVDFHSGLKTAPVSPREGVLVFDPLGLNQEASKDLHALRALWIAHGRYGLAALEVPPSSLTLVASLASQASAPSLESAESTWFDPLGRRNQLITHGRGLALTGLPWTGVIIIGQKPNGQLQWHSLPLWVSNVASFSHLNYLPEPWPRPVVVEPCPRWLTRFRRAEFSGLLRLLANKPRLDAMREDILGLGYFGPPHPEGDIIVSVDPRTLRGRWDHAPAIANLARVHDLHPFGRLGTRPGRGCQVGRRIWLRGPCSHFLKSRCDGTWNGQDCLHDHMSPESPLYIVELLDQVEELELLRR